MSLATIQRGLKELVKTGATRSDDPYVRSLMQPDAVDRVQLVREIVLWWRTFGVQRACPMTSRLLARDGRLDRAVDDFVAGSSISPYIEDLALSFVEANRSDADPRVAAVASFEASVMRAKRGDPRRRVTQWPEEPYAVLAALLSNGPLPQGPGAPHWTIAGADIPGWFEVSAEPPVA